MDIAVGGMLARSVNVSPDNRTHWGIAVIPDMYMYSRSDGHRRGRKRLASLHVSKTLASPRGRDKQGQLPSTLPRLIRINPTSSERNRGKEVAEWSPQTTGVVILDPETGSKPTKVVLVVFLGLLLPDFQSTKAFSFQNRPSLNFTHRLKTILSTIAP